MKNLRVIPLLVSLASPAAADVLSVGGPAPDFGDIAPAVSAASNGDVIRIWPGTYGVFTIDDKSLTLVRATPSGAIDVDGTYRIMNLSEDREVEITAVSATGVDGPGLIVQECEGSVRIREATFEGSDSPDGFPWKGFPAVRVLQSRDVELTYCTVSAGHPPSGEYGGPGSHGLSAAGSRVSIFASTLEGSGGTTDYDPGASGYGGGSGVDASGNGKIFISGSTLIGGHGGAADPDKGLFTGGFGYGGYGGDGYSGTTPAWFVDNVYQPGLGGWSPDPTQFGGDGVETTGGTHLPGDARILRASGLTDDGAGIGLRFEGTQGDRVYVLLSDSADYRFHPDRGPRLVAVPGPAAPPATGTAPLWKLVGILPASGVLITTLPVDELPAFGHETVHLQGAFIGEESYFGSSSWSVVLDTAW